MDIKYHNLFGMVFITAKVNINHKTHYYVANHLNREKVLEKLFNMIREDNPTTYPTIINQPMLQTA